MKYLFFTFIAIFSLTRSFALARSPEYDQALATYKNGIHVYNKGLKGTRRAHTLYKEAQKLETKDRDRAIEKHDQALAIFTEAYENLKSAHKTFSQAVRQYRIALKIDKEDNDQTLIKNTIADIYWYVGAIYDYLRDVQPITYEKQVRNLKNSIKYFSMSIRQYVRAGNITTSENVQKSVNELIAELENLEMPAHLDDDTSDFLSIKETSDRDEDLEQLLVLDPASAGEANVIVPAPAAQSSIEIQSDAVVPAPVETVNSPMISEIESQDIPMVTPLSKMQKTHAEKRKGPARRSLRTDMGFSFDYVPVPANEFRPFGVLPDAPARPNSNKRIRP